MRNHQHNGGRKNAKHQYLLSGKVFCRECGKAMVGNARYSGRNKALYITYRCPSQRYSCQNKEISRDYLEQYVIAVLEREILSPSAMKQITQRIQETQEESSNRTKEQQQNIEHKIRKITMEIDNIADAIGQGLISPALTTRLTALEGERTELEAIISKGEEREQAIIDPDMILAQYMALRKTPALPEYRAFIGALIARISVGRYSVDLTLRTGLGILPAMDTTLAVRRHAIYQMEGRP